MGDETVATRVRGEFEEMPGLILTEDQAVRLFGIERRLCRDVIEQLIGASYLQKTRSGSVRRAEV